MKVHIPIKLGTQWKWKTQLGQALTNVFTFEDYNNYQALHVNC